MAMRMLLGVGRRAAVAASTAAVGRTSAVAAGPAAGRVAMRGLAWGLGGAWAQAPARAYARVAGDSHSDFQPQRKQQEESAAQASLHDKLQAVIDEHPVLVFMKGEPDQPMCGFSMNVVQMFKMLNVPFAGVNVLASDALREGVKEFSDWPTIPQIYIKGEFYGGHDIMYEDFSNGQLKAFLAEKGLIKAAADGDGADGAGGAGAAGAGAN